MFHKNHEEPKLALLSMIPDTLVNCKKGLLRYYLTAALTVISRHWHSQTPPTMGGVDQGNGPNIRNEADLGGGRGQAVTVTPPAWAVWLLHHMPVINIFVMESQARVFHYRAICP